MTTTARPATAAPTPETLAAEWQASPALRREFPSLEAYGAYRRAVAAGRVKVLAPTATRAATTAPTPETIAAEWQASPAIRGEFPSLEAYGAYRRAEAAGRVKIHRGAVTR
jgi:hypothetical protein